MNLRDAAAQYIKATRLMNDAKRDREEAKAVLLPHFRKSARKTQFGVAYSATEYRQLDTTKARALLGKRAVDAEEVRTRETLTPVD